MKRNVKNWIALLLAGGMLMGMTGCLNPNLLAEELGELMQENTVGNREQSEEEGTRGTDQSNVLMLPGFTFPNQNLPDVSEQSTAAEKRILTVTVDGIIDQGSRKVIALSFDNQTGNDVCFFSASGHCVLQVTTDRGVYDTELGNQKPLPTGKSYRTLTTEYAPGEVRQITMTLMRASLDTIVNVEIYNAENAVSTAVCDFASGSFSGESTTNVAIEGFEAHSEPQSGALLIAVDGIIDQGSCKTIALYCNNRTGQPVEWAWARTAYLIVTTDAGVYSLAIECDPIAIGTGYITFTREDCPGEVMNVTLSNLCVLNADGFPEEELTNICIYDHSANLTSTICVQN